MAEYLEKSRSLSVSNCGTRCANIGQRAARHALERPQQSERGQADATPYEPLHCPVAVGTCFRSTSLVRRSELASDPARFGRMGECRLFQNPTRFCEAKHKVSPRAVSVFTASRTHAYSGSFGSTRRWRMFVSSRTLNLTSVVIAVDVLPVKGGGRQVREISAHLS